MEEQLTIRIPKKLGTALAKEAKARGVKRSQVVREALAQYLTGDSEEDWREAVRRQWEGIKPHIGSMALDHEAVMADPIARQIYERNWRNEPPGARDTA